MNLKRIYRYLVIVGLTFFLGINLPLAWGEPVTTIRDNGDSANRVDFVILGDGYTASELTKYANDVENAINGFFNQEPFREYQDYFNVHRVDVISNESGADHPPNIYKDTAFDATYNCGGSQRRICVDSSKVNTVLSNSVNPDQKDMILVLVNDTTYGGSGGYLAVASTHSSCIELVLHEVGHSFGLLADEYDYGSCYTAHEPSQPNVTMETNRDLIKWNIGGGPPTGWIDPATSIPTFGTSNGIPGLYEGAYYCPSGVYRPTYNSKMRSLHQPFEQINEEQLVKRIYNWVSPLDSSTPYGTQLVLEVGESQLFQIQILEPLNHTLDVEWYVDNQYKSDGLQFTFDSSIFGQGDHTVEVVVRDYTSKVRYDPANVLIEQRNWDIAVVTSGGFIDIPPGYWAYEAIYKIYNAGVTKGCSQTPLMYCPNNTVTRTQMAVFLGRAIHGSSFTPPTAIGYFSDVPVSYWAADWIEQFYRDGITSGCSTSPLRYCPGNNVTRAQMAIFLLRSKHGSSYTPPAASGIFADIPVTYWAADWIEQLYHEGITTGCSTGPLRYCPENSVTRAQMAVFITRTFGL